MPDPLNESAGYLSVAISDRRAPHVRWYWASLMVAVAFVVTGLLELQLVRAAGAGNPVLVEWLLLPWAPLGMTVSIMVICVVSGMLTPAACATNIEASER